MTFYIIMFGYLVLRLTMKYGAAIAHRQEERAFEREYQSSKMAAEEATRRFEAWREVRRQQQPRFSAATDMRLQDLGLSKYPTSKIELRQARNAALLRFHCDRPGGDEEKTRLIVSSYDSLLRDYDIANSA